MDGQTNIYDSGESSPVIQWSLLHVQLPPSLRGVAWFRMHRNTALYSKYAQRTQEFYNAPLLLRPEILSSCRGLGTIPGPSKPSPHLSLKQII